MANVQENDDECLARRWLERQGYLGIKRQCNDPPDYMFSDDNGCHAVEVRRLNLMSEVNGRFGGEEEIEIPLRNIIEEVLAEFDPPSEGRIWHFHCEYTFSSLPKSKDVKFLKKEIHKIFELVSSPHNLVLCFHLKCGIRLEFFPGSPGTTKFVLIDVSNGKGIFVLGKLEKNIQICIEEKRKKISSRIEKFNDCDWWLLLIDHIGHVSDSGVSESELKALQKTVPLQEPWSRIVIISSKNPDWFYELIEKS